MKKAQSIVEYAILTILVVLLCAALFAFWNRNAVAQSASGGVIDQNNVLHIPPMESAED